MASRITQRLFVGGIPWTVSGRELRQLFQQFGPVTSSSVIFDNQTGLSKGYGFVNFADKESFTRALRQKTLFVEGNFLNIQPAVQN